MDDRFIFGKGTRAQPFKVTEPLQFILGETENEDIVQLVSFEVESTYVEQEYDDIAHGIANAFVNKWTVVADNNNSYVSGNGQINANVYLNGELKDEPLNYVSSYTFTVTVDSVGDFVCLKEGVATITVIMVNNANNKAIIEVSATERTEDYRFVVTPGITELKQFGKQIFDVRVYNYA